jgi:hypothetical protein
VHAEYVQRWLIAFVCTQLIEMPSYRRLLRVSWLRAFGASAITHPLIWWVIFPALAAPYWTTVALAELFAVLAEGLWFTRGVGARRAFAASLVANSASFVFGLLSRALFGAP